MESIKISKLEIENVKRVKAVTIEPTVEGLTIIGGNNGQGKTSVLDAIAWALGGEKYRPSKPNREGSVLPPNLHIVLSNGLVVDRAGKNSSLKVTDPTGKRAGQNLLNEFVETLALDLPKFMESNDKEKAQTLLNIIGVGDELSKLEMEETQKYQERLTIGRIADQKKKYAMEQVFYPEAPKDLISPQELINQQQIILANNGENARKRQKVSQYEYQVKSLTDEVARMEQLLLQKQNDLNAAMNDLKIAKTDALDLVDQSTEELEKNLANIEEINIKVRANLNKEKAEEDAKEYEDKYKELTAEIETIRTSKMKLLKTVDMPLPELSVENGKLIYKNQEWDNMSSSEQLRVATAIIRKLNPKCGFVLVDKLEQMDLTTLNEYGQWLKQEGLQAIATRVSTGDECSIIIEDGYVKGKEMHEKEAITPLQPIWKAGEF